MDACNGPSAPLQYQSGFGASARPRTRIVRARPKPTAVHARMARQLWDSRAPRTLHATVHTTHVPQATSSAQRRCRARCQRARTTRGYARVCMCVHSCVCRVPPCARVSERPRARLPPCAVCRCAPMACTRSSCRARRSQCHASECACVWGVLTAAGAARCGSC
jgi:hypothetical protein